jgi:hypothetical protein
MRGCQTNPRKTNAIRDLRKLRVLRCSYVEEASARRQIVDYGIEVEKAGEIQVAAFVAGGVSFRPTE